MGVILTDLLTFTSLSNKTSGEADLLTGRGLLTALPLFTELSAGGILVLVRPLDGRDTTAGLAGLFLCVQASLVTTPALRETGGGGLLTGELLTAGPLPGILDLEMIVLGGTLGRDDLVCRVIFGSSMVTGVIFTLLGSFL